MIKKMEGGSHFATVGPRRESISPSGERKGMALVFVLVSLLLNTARQFAEKVFS
jgi:hypothetical protein